MSQTFEDDKNQKTLSQANVSLIEALIFASRGISKSTLLELTEISEDELNTILEYLKAKYASNEHGIELKQIEDYYRFYTKPQFSDVVSRVAKRRNLGSLLPSQLEIAVFLAVRRQATKLEIDSMRGKDSSNLIKQLLISGVIKRRKLGRTFVYSLTDTFKDESMIEELIRQAGGASFESIGKMFFENSETSDTQNSHIGTSRHENSDQVSEEGFEIIKEKLDFHIEE